MSATPEATLHWTESGQACSALWRSERGAPAPRRVQLADDTLSADAAYKLACEGTALLWRGDFQNARQLLQALARRADRPARRAGAPAKGPSADAGLEAGKPAAGGQAFHRYRQAQSQRARVLGMLLLQFGPDFSLDLRRAPDARQACAEAWGPPHPAQGCVASMRELLGLISAHEWRKKGVEVPALGPPPGNRIYPHYGVFSPVRGEYVALVLRAPLPAGASIHPVFDVGTGTGVLAAVLARRGLTRIVATDQEPRALACARENLQRLDVAGSVDLVQANLFPDAASHGKAALIVCNPPWIPARAGSPIEHAVYDEESRMLLGFLGGLAGHLLPSGEGWLILSNIAELLGLRTRDDLLRAVDAAGLRVLGRMDTQPRHPKATDPSDPLHSARSAEVTSLWRLGAC